MYSENGQNPQEPAETEQTVCQRPIIHFAQNDVAQLYPEGSVIQLLNQTELIEDGFAAVQHPESSSNGCDCKGLQKIRNK